MRIEGRMVRVFVLFPRRDALGFQHPHKDCPPTPDPSSAFFAVVLWTPKVGQRNNYIVCE